MIEYFEDVLSETHSIISKERQEIAKEHDVEVDDVPKTKEELAEWEKEQGFLSEKMSE